MVRVHKYLNQHLKTSSNTAQRLFDIVLYACNNLAAPVFTVVLSFILIKRVSLVFWGEYVSALLILNVCIMVAGWGHKEFLLRAFSKHPAQIALNWQNNLLCRAVVCCLGVAVLVVYFDYSSVRLLSVVAFVVFSFVYKSMDVLILYKKTFSFSAIIELIGYVVLAGVLLIYPAAFLTLDVVLLWSAGIILLKCILSIWYLRKDIFPLQKLNPFFSLQNTLLLSLPFFLPSLAGLLQTKADLYSVAWFLPKEDVGAYQIFTSLINVPHLVAGFAVMPFLKNIYRLPVGAIHKMIRLLSIAGALLCIPAMGMIYILTEHYYGFSFSIRMYVLGYLQIIPFFIYLIKIHMLFRSDRQYAVLMVLLLASIVSTVFSILLIPQWGLEGAIFVNALTQWFTLTLFSYYTFFSINRSDVVTF
jgi:O-antigen/teichoic acid export membrane protein